MQRKGWLEAFKQYCYRYNVTAEAFCCCMIVNFWMFPLFNILWSEMKQPFSCKSGACWSMVHDLMLMIYVFNLYQKIKALFCSVRQVQPLVDNICHFTSEGQLPLFAIDTDIFSSLLQMTLEESMARRYDYF